MTNFGFAFLVAITFTMVFETNGSPFERRSGDMAEYLERDKRGDDDKKLTSKTLRIELNQFIIDLKQNSRGRFIVVTEVYPDERKNRVSFPMSIVPKVCDQLTSFADFHTDIGKNLRNGGRRRVTDNLKSADIRGAQRQIYFDLKENRRGYYLRISSISTDSRQRHTVTIPAPGIIAVRNVFTQMIKMFGEHKEPQKLPASQEMRIGGKRFHFDIGSTSRGTFMRISELTDRYRSSITIPQQGLRKFKDILGYLMSKLNH